MNYEAAGDFPNAIAALDCALRYAIDRRAYGEAGDLQQQIEGLRGNLAQLGITPADIDAGDLIRLPSDFAVTNNPALGPAKA